MTGDNMDKTGFPVDLILSKLAENTIGAQARGRQASEIMTGPLEAEIAQTPYEIVHQEASGKLVLRARKTAPDRVRPLLVIYALNNRETMLDLQLRQKRHEKFSGQGHGRLHD
ncbi:MAG: hypothetical protein R2874_05215 [Desulfobacterales bacterium]